MRDVILPAAIARVTSVGLSDEQLALDRRVAEREGLPPNRFTTTFLATLAEKR